MCWPIYYAKQVPISITIDDFTLVLQATLPGTWSQEPLYSLSEFRYIVYSLAYERRLFTRIRRPLLHPVESSLPTCTRGQVLWLDQSNTVHKLNASRSMACLNHRVEKHLGWAACLEARKWRWRDLNPRHTPQWVVPAIHWTTLTKRS